MPKKKNGVVVKPNGPVNVPSTKPTRDYSAETTARAERQQLLTDKAIMFYMRGLSQERAYNLAFKPKGDPDKRNSMACEWFGRQSVVERMTELCEAARVSDLDNVGSYIRDLLGAVTETRDSKQWTAHANLMRQRQQVLGLATSNVSVSVEHRLTDVQLVAQIAAGDVQMAIALKAKLGSEHTFE